MEQLEGLVDIWPARAGQTLDIWEIRDRIADVLTAVGEPPRGPAHLSFLVADLARGESLLQDKLSEPLKVLYRAVVAPFAVELVRYRCGPHLVELVSAARARFFCRLPASERGRISSCRLRGRQSGPGDSDAAKRAVRPRDRHPGRRPARRSDFHEKSPVHTRVPRALPSRRHGTSVLSYFSLVFLIFNL